jgi:PAS domain S-box-containing protein
MKADKRAAVDLAALRRRAEQLLRGEPHGDADGMADKKTQSLLRELQVHQIELELQNEELIRSREEIERTLERFTDLFDRAPVGYFTIDREGAIRQVNVTGAALLGAEPPAVANRHFTQFVAAEARPNFTAFLKTVFEGRIRRLWEGPLLRANGRTRFVRIQAMLPQAGDECRIAALDITARRRTEEALRKSEEQYRLIAANVMDVIWTADLSLKLQFVSPAVTRLRGYSVEEAVRQRPDEIFTPASLETLNRFLAEAREREETAAAEPGRVGSIDLEQQCQNGETIWTECQFAYLRNEDGRPNGVICVSRDITDRRRVQQERLTMETQFRHQQKLESIGTLASGVAHEINNPLMGIMNFAELIQANEMPREKVQNFAGKIVAESARAAKIVRNLLAFSRHDNEEHSPAQIENIIQTTLSLIETALRNDEIVVTVNVQKGAPAFRCRSQQMQQVILNLVTNARDALNQRYPGRDPGKTLSICAGRLDKDGQPWLRLVVEDGGIGIDPKIRSRIFDPFFSTKPRHLGTGLGLSVSHGIVREHGGELWVESCFGEYSRFYVDLPVDNGWRLERDLIA